MQDLDRFDFILQCLALRDKEKREFTRAKRAVEMVVCEGRCFDCQHSDHCAAYKV